MPVESSFSEDEDVEEVLKNAGSVWLGLPLPALPVWLGLMGDDLS